MNLVSLGIVAEQTADKLDKPGVTGAVVEDAVDVSLKGESEVANVNAIASDPELAAQIADTFATEYIAFRQRADRQRVLEVKAQVERRLEALTPAERLGAEGSELRRQAQQLAVVAALQTGDAELVQHATPNATPVSPKPARNTGLALAVGLLLGIGLAFLLDQLDTRIKDEEEVEDVYGMPILARIPHGTGEGPKAFDPVGLGIAVAESFRLLHANLRYFNVGRKLDTLLVTSTAPQEGKTTVSWGLAATEASSGKSVLLIESDLRQPTLASRLETKPESGLSLILAEVDSLDDAIVAVPVSPDSSAEVHVVPAGHLPPNSAELLESPAMTALLEEARSRFDLVLIDTPPVQVADAIPLMSQVSGILIVARLKASRVDAARNLRDLLTHLDVSPLGVIVNDAPTARGGYYMSYARHSRAVQQGE